MVVRSLCKHTNTTIQSLQRKVKKFTGYDRGPFGAATDILRGESRP